LWDIGVDRPRDEECRLAFAVEIWEYVPALKPWKYCPIVCGIEYAGSDDLFFREAFINQVISQ